MDLSRHAPTIHPGHRAEPALHLQFRLPVPTAVSFLVQQIQAVATGEGVQAEQQGAAVVGGNTPGDDLGHAQNEGLGQYPVCRIVEHPGRLVFVEVQLHEGIAARSDGGGCVFHDAKVRRTEGMRLKMTSLLNRKT